MAPLSDVPVPFQLWTAPNFRDLGGHATVDGRRVRWRTLFRTGHLSMLDDDDLAAIDALGIRTVVDFRAADERTSRPARWARMPDRMHGSRKETLVGAMRNILTPEATVEDVRRGFTAFYVDLPELYREELALLFGELAEGALPLLIGCTAGKDRTGLASALLLLTLGVPHDAVFADYVETNARVPGLKRQRGEAPVGGKAGDSVRQRASPELLDVMWEANPVYLGAALAAIDERYGSVEAYVEQALGVNAAKRARLRERLTEPA